MADDEMQFYDPEARKEIYRRHLPHWSQAGRIYFVTFRLADSIPAERAAKLSGERQAWCKAHPEPRTPDRWHEYHVLFSTRIEQWLDQCSGSCLLADPSCAQIVADSMASFDGQALSTRRLGDHAQSRPRADRAERGLPPWKEFFMPGSLSRRMPSTES